MPNTQKFRRMRYSLYKHRRKTSKCNIKDLRKCTRSRGCKKVKKGHTKYCRKIKYSRKY